MARDMRGQPCAWHPWARRQPGVRDAEAEGGGVGPRRGVHVEGQRDVAGCRPGPRLPLDGQVRRAHGPHQVSRIPGLPVRCALFDPLWSIRLSRPPRHTSRLRPALAVRCVVREVISRQAYRVHVCALQEEPPHDTAHGPCRHAVHPQHPSLRHGPCPHLRLPQVTLLHCSSSFSFPTSWSDAAVARTASHMRPCPRTHRALLIIVELS